MNSLKELRKKCEKIHSTIFATLLILSILLQTVSAQSGGNTQCNDCPVRDRENGILVGQTKLFDEKSFRTMLQGLEENLSSLRLINQQTLIDNYGRLQGGRLSTSSFGVNVTGLPVPGIATTANTGETTTSNTVTTDSATPSTVTTLGTVSPNTVQQVITSQPATPSVPTAPAQTSTFTAPQIGVSSQDLLSEQISLQYQIMDLRLLLERSLTDRILTETNGNSVTFVQRNSAIVGFQVSIDPPKNYRDAVAEVEIVVDSETDAKGVERPVANAPNQQPGQAPPQNANSNSGALTNNEKSQKSDQTKNLGKKPPSVVMLLPRDKSYNVAAATKDAKSIGLGAVLQVINVGVNAGKTNEALYIVGDTDTVAFERKKLRTKIESLNNINPTATAFGWQFRPVLGQETVKSGMRQVYALLALPDGGWSYKSKVKVYTRWRRYDAKNKIVKDVIPNSESFSDLNDLDVNIGAADILKPGISSLEWQDIGEGRILVNAKGYNYLDGISILAGNKMVSSPADGLNVQGDRSFVWLLPSQTAGQINNPFLIGRYGDPTEFMYSYPNERNFAGWGIRISDVSAKPINAQMSKVRISLKPRTRNFQNDQDTPQPTIFNYSYNDAGVQMAKAEEIRPIVLVGGKAFGFSDSPLIKESSNQKDTLIYSFLAPTQLLKDAQKLKVKELFRDKGYSDEMNISWVGAFSPTQVTTLFSNSTKASLAISGGSFDKCKVINVAIGENGFFQYTPPPAMFGDATKPCTGTAPAPPATSVETLNLRSSSMITLNANQEDLKGAKQLIVFQEGDDPVAIALSAPPEVPDPMIEKQDKVNVGNVGTIKLFGSNLSSIEDITFEGKSLTPKLLEEPNNSLQINLNSTIVSVPGYKQLNLVLKNGKSKTFILVVEK